MAHSRSAVRQCNQSQVLWLAAATYLEDDDSFGCHEPLTNSLKQGRRVVLASLCLLGPVRQQGWFVLSGCRLELRKSFFMSFKAANAQC